MKTIKKDFVFFLIGGIGYGLIEILWRGYTHWAMLAAGGICFVIFSHIAETFKEKTLLAKALICAACVTSIEMFFGVFFNIILKENIWDYSSMPFNFMGQVCLMYTVLWGVLGLIFIPIAEKINKKLGF